jgi:hypothetical protein
MTGHPVGLCGTLRGQRLGLGNGAGSKLVALLTEGIGTMAGTNYATSAQLESALDHAGKLPILRERPLFLA